MEACYIHQSVIFFSLQRNSWHYLIMRPQRTRYYPSNIRERYSCWGGSICVLDSISLDRLTGLHINGCGTLYAYVYRDGFIDACVPLSGDTIGDDFILRHRKTARESHHRRLSSVPKISANGMFSSITVLESYGAFWTALGKCDTVLNPSLQIFAMLAAALHSNGCYFRRTYR